MKVKPKTEKEIYEANLLPKGWYPFTIATAEDKLSKAAKERGETEPNMIALNIKVYKDTGFVFVKDWLMDSEFGAAKLRQCADTCGVLDKYNACSLDAEDLLEREGFVELGIEKSKDEQFGDKNKILKYAKEVPKPKGDDSKPGAGPSKDDPEDDIPFN